MVTENAPLGNTAKFSPTSSQRQIMRYYLQNQAKELLPQERVAQCHRAMVPLADRVQILHDPDVKRAYFRNLIICARIWQCPVCAARITEERRREIQQGMERIVERSVLITYTLQHSKYDNLTTLLDALLNAIGRMKAARAWSKFTDTFNWIGSIRALEVTHGINGWHPHFHELAFVEPTLSLADIDDMERQLRSMWLHQLNKQGRDASWERGLTVQPTFGDVEEYVEKFGRDPIDDTWSAARELAKAPSKQRTKDGRTPLKLLYDYGRGDNRSGYLFTEFVTAFKGKHQLNWSPGLRDYMGLEDKSDEEAAAEIPENAMLLAILTDQQWRVILRKNRRGELLEIAAKGDVEELWQWLYDLGVELTVEVNATNYMWEQYEKAKRPS
jgi:hypothetical protein